VVSLTNDDSVNFFCRIFLMQQVQGWQIGDVFCQIRYVSYTRARDTATTHFLTSCPGHWCPHLTPGTGGFSSSAASSGTWQQSAMYITFMKMKHRRRLAAGTAGRRLHDIFFFRHLPDAGAMFTTIFLK
jgi:hypothetical protein